MPENPAIQKAREMAAAHGNTGGADARSPGPEQTQGERHLPLWSHNKEYGVPVAMLRSALFGVIKRGRRPFLENEPINSWPDLAVTYTGKRLDQADLDVWLQSVQLHQEQRAAGLGSEIHFQITPFLREIRRHTGSQNIKWLQESIGRLVEGTVYIETKEREYGGHLIDDFDLSKKTGLYVLRINPKMAAMFDYGWSKLELEARLSLGRSQLHKALHGFIYSHRASPKRPLEVGHGWLVHLFGEGYGRRRDFLREVRKALQDLKAKGLLREVKERDGAEEGVFVIVR